MLSAKSNASNLSYSIVFNIFWSGISIWDWFLIVLSIFNSIGNKFITSSLYLQLLIIIFSNPKLQRVSGVYLLYNLSFSEALTIGLNLLNYSNILDVKT